MKTDQINVYEGAKCRGLSWAAVFGGVFSSMGIGILLALLGAGFGLAAFKANADAAAALGTGAVVWFVVSGIIAMFVCGWVASFFARSSCLMKGTLHGLVAWSLATIIGVAIVNTGAGMLIVGAGQLIGKTVSVATQSIGGVAVTASQGAALIAKDQNKQIQSMINQVKQLAQQGSKQAQQKTGVKSTQDLVDAVLNPNSEVRNNIIQAFKTYVGNSDQNQKDQLRQAVIDQLVKNTHLNAEQAGQVVDKWQQRYQQITEQLTQQVQQAKVKAQEMAETASNQLSKAAFAAFFTLLLGALATIAGSCVAVIGHRRRQVADLLA